MRRGSLDCICDVGERADFRLFRVQKRCKDYVNVIWHDNDGRNVDALAIIVQAGLKYCVANGFGKNPFLVRTEGKEVRLAVALQMRKLSTIEGLRHGPRGNSRPRLPGGAKRFWI